MELMEVESDLTSAIALITEDLLEHSPCIILRKDCKALLEAMGCRLRLTSREGNKVMDRLANMCIDQEHKMVSHIIPHDDLISLLETDMRGVAFDRF
ncbi:hypothetical protein RHMOL_Rhmol06G0280900 [Rhododendron molle]|uniref:Uncharacterized protein n=1 Tax=Rhododendron molle TaxID=49168 RepID=A0ACC0NH89_RHOML|nr:hypothetical protein RHMOL_Rhmol06G0280900 [Rhododendron molle]